MTGIAIITGGGDGLGRELAYGFARSGYGVVVADVDERAARACVAGLGEYGTPARAVRADVRQGDDLDLVVQAARELGGPHVLVNNAGGWTPEQQYPEASAAEWAATVDLNLLAPMRLTQRVLEPMRERGGGAIVNIASSGGVGFEAYGSPEYGAAKAGLIRFTSSLAALDGIRVMCVAPDWIGLDRAHIQWQRMSVAERYRSGPLIPPSEVVAVVLDLVRHGVGGTVVEMWGGRQPIVRTPRRDQSGQSS
ncbi:short-chain dehydrogenase [Actinoplanes italicus]|uniref:3-oxoacyl-[acyl-carrier protein] reductase n=1 Tax=Actinoplanes italicus TaxID=113567 RepID=A0A2T0KF76_9ACTN|nr:SDR family oxidoreductase [Actinoplanes italicus]PRX22026.1 3-oxoacyl-[acyl-carrier protein] reductase [Actinoplanes italicus]GIE29555.1 short-chain dehydrogenase [Actinoplanes italicus]